MVRVMPVLQKRPVGMALARMDLPGVGGATIHFLIIDAMYKPIIFDITIVSCPRARGFYYPPTIGVDVGPSCESRWLHLGSPRSFPSVSGAPFGYPFECSWSALWVLVLSGRS